MYQPEIEDLQFEVHQLKKLNLDLKSENQILKVKLRKADDEINKTYKQLHQMFDPKKNGNIIKLLSRQAATLITKLREENVILHKNIAEKDLHIKKLQSDLETVRLYIDEKLKTTCLSSKLIENQDLFEKIKNLNNSCYFKETTKSNIKPRSRSVTNEKKTKSRPISPAVKESLSATDLEKNYAKLLNDNLQKIKQYGNMKGDKCSQPCESALSSKNDTPHEEIQQLQSYLLNVLNEVDYLKTTINHLQREQTRTTCILSGKNKINRVLSEIENRKTIQPQGNNNNQRKTESETEPITTDVPSSKCSTCDCTVDSDYNEVTGSSSTASRSYSKSECVNKMKDYNLKCVCVQTTRSFCTQTAPYGHSKQTSTTDGNTNVDEYGIEIEYIN